MIKKVAENITKLRTQSKRNDLKNLLPQDEYKLYWLIAKQSLSLKSLKNLKLKESRTKYVKYFVNWDLQKKKKIVMQIF